MDECYDKLEHSTPVEATVIVVEEFQGERDYLIACSDCADYLARSRVLRRLGYRYTIFHPEDMIFALYRD